MSCEMIKFPGSFILDIVFSVIETNGRVRCITRRLLTKLVSLNYVKIVFGVLYYYAISIRVEKSYVKPYDVRCYATCY